MPELGSEKSFASEIKQTLLIDQGFWRNKRMNYHFGKIIVVALGGSIIFPENIDSRFLRKFKAFIRPFLRTRKFIIVTGGGRLARLYQEAAGKVSDLKDEDKDWLGIHATRSNAHLLRTIFRDVANPVVIDSRYKIKKLRRPITIASGWRPGWSTDYIAVALAEDFGVREVIIAGKPDYVYDKDPHGARGRARGCFANFLGRVIVEWSPTNGYPAPMLPLTRLLRN